MNGRMAKALRRKAHEMSVGLPWAKYRDIALNPEKPTRRTRQLYECGKRDYHDLKRMWRTKVW